MLEDLLFQPRGSVVEWVERELRLPRETSPNAPGPVSLDRQPYMREPLECLRNTRIEHLYLVWAAQTGKTTLDLLALAYLLEHDPMPLLWALPSDNLAAPFSRNRLQPFLKANPCLARHILRNPASFAPLEMTLDNMPIYMTGVTSPARLSSRPIAYVIQDEEAKFEHINKKEAHPSALIEERTKAFPRRLIIHSSTPNVEDEPYWQGYSLTDCREYFMPCPHCGMWIRFEFSRATLVWDGDSLEEIEASARYVCPDCSRPIYDAQKIDMMQAGEWRATNEAAHPSRRGYHLNSLYSPFVSFGQFARKFVESSRALLAQMELQNFRNSWEALPYAKYQVKVKDQAVEALKTSAYRRGEMPPVEPLYLVAGYDPGELQTHWVVCAVTAGGELWVIDWGTILSFRTEGGRKGVAAHFPGLLYQTGDQIFQPALGLVDSGWSAEATYTECALMPGQLYPTKGSAAGFGIWNRTDLKTHPGLELYTYQDRAAKIELYAERIAHGRGPGLHLPGNADPDLIRGLSGQVLEEKPGSPSQWKKIAGDHYGDCVKLCMFSWWVLKASFPDSEPEEEERERDGGE